MREKLPNRAVFSGSKPLLFVLGLITAFSFLIFLPYLAGHWQLADDAFQSMLPGWRFQQRVLHLGQWPHWNLNEGFGKPTALNNSNFIFYYPPVPIWGWLVGWSEISYLYFLMLHWVVGGYLAFRFALRTLQSIEASVFFALTYIGNGFALGYFSSPEIVFPYLLWPLLGEGLWDLHENKETAAIPKIALALVLIETGGYPLTKILIYVTSLVAASGLFRRHWKPLLKAGTIAVLCAAPEWATSIRSLPLADRLGVDIYHDIAYGSPTNFLALSTMLVPTSFLRRDVFQLGMVWLERSWWVGALTLGLIFAATRTESFRWSRYKKSALIALGCMLFAMGGHSFFRELCSLALPVLSHLRFANMGRMVPMAFLIFMGAASLARLQVLSKKKISTEKSGSQRRMLKFFWAGLLLCIVVVGSYYPRDLDPANHWEWSVLHTGFFLLLAYTASVLDFRLRQNGNWAWALVALQFFALLDVAIAFRHLVAIQVDTPLKSAETFELASSQPNERSVRDWLDGDDWIRWDGNKKVFNAYTVPYHRWMLAAAQSPSTRRFAASLVSCQDNAAEIRLTPQLPGNHSCADQRIQIDRYYGNTVQLSFSNAHPAWVMVHDFVDPDWHASLNGKDIPIYSAYSRFKAVELPPGTDWKISFEYRHPWFPMLWWVSTFGFVLLACACRFREEQ